MSRGHRTHSNKSGGEETRGLRIVTQYWRGRTRVCELEAFGQPLDLRFSPDSASNGWLVEAQSGHEARAQTLSETALTCTAALVAVGRSWTERATSLGLPTFDWEAVTGALRAVRVVD